MKLKLLLLITLSVSALSLEACPKPTETTLTQQYESGALQWQIVRKEIDPNTLIHQAILENAPEVIRFLLSHGVKVDYPDENGMSPLTIAILNKSTDGVEVLLTNGANPNPGVRWNDMSLLDLTFTLKDFTSTKLLVEYGVDVNAKSKFDCALSKAIDLAWIDIAILMINKGANIYSDSANCPFAKAVLRAGSHNDLILLKLFLQKGANVNTVFKRNDGKEFSSPLLLLASGGNLTALKFLIDSGADVNKAVRLPCGKILTPLGKAVDGGNREIVQYLLQHGARA